MYFRQQKLALAYFEWRKKKNIKNLKKILIDGFHGGRLSWKIWRVIKNTISGKYEMLYQQYWKEYDK